MNTLARRIWPVALLLATGCGGHTTPSAAPSGVATTQSVVLVSLDAFRWDYLQRPYAVNLRRLAAEGVHAQRMIPAFPSLTFPNHYTLVTGLYPEHHGIVSNTIFDSTLGTFRISDTAAVRNPAWWGGEPIWVTAEKQGVRSGAFFWPGSEAGQGGVRPTRWLKFNDRFPNAARVDSVLDWLTLPGDQALRMITLYYSDVDHAGHSYGPDSPQVDSAIARVDTMIGKLMDGIAARGLSHRVNLIVVSDHGMTGRSPDRAIFLDDYINLNDVTIVEAASLGQLIPKPGKLETVYAALHGHNPHMAVYRKADVPARFHYNDNRRITPIVIIPDTGFTLTTHAAFAVRPPTGGEHGYDNLLPTMGASFIAAGPAFRHDYTSAPFQNIHVYDLLCHILGIRPAPNDGSLDSTRVLLQPR
ncbi:MAG TPA: ectonucleotide pyrophosphatase/phosphodiesterase [Gemmatimonadales bacterium]